MRSLLLALVYMSFVGSAIRADGPTPTPTPGNPVPVPVADTIEVNLDIWVYDNGIFAPYEGAKVVVVWDQITVGTFYAGANGRCDVYKATYVRPKDNATVKIYVNDNLVDTITFTQNAKRDLTYFVP